MGDNDTCSWPLDGGCSNPSERFVAWDLPGKPSVPRMFCKIHNEQIKAEDLRRWKYPWQNQSS